MIGLILKDYYALRSYFLKQMGLMLVIYLFIGFMMKSVAILPAMLIMTLMMMLISTFSVDESSQFYSYALTLPLSPRDIIAARYLLFFGVLLGGTAAASLLCTLVDMVSFREGALTIWASSLIVVLIYTLVSSVCLPIFVKFGTEKARLWMTLTFMVPFFLVFWGASWLSTSGIPMPSEQQLKTLFLPLIGAGTLLCGIAAYISYRVSVSIFSAKEF